LGSSVIEVRRPQLRHSVGLAALVVAGAIALAACGSATSSSPATASASVAPAASASASAATSQSPSGTLTIYAGRSEELVGPLIEQFKAANDVDVKVEYAGTTDLAATILEEGSASPADVFFAQDAGALGAVAAEGRLAELPSDTLGKVDERFVSDDGQWVGVSGRARVVIYDSRTLSQTDMPDTIAAFTDPAWKGRIGWAPTNASLQSFVTAFRVLEGDDAARAWLEGIQANEPKVYDGNDAVLAAVAAGEIEVGFVNHYYLMRQLAEQGDGFPVRNHFLPGGDPGSLVNVAGAGILSSAPNPVAAQAFVDFLLTRESQTYFADETFEYPLVDGIAANAALPALGEIQSPDIDLSDLADLQGTLDLMQAAGVL
jgi:iron(III) transport system substrate-binding protein